MLLQSVSLLRAEACTSRAIRTLGIGLRDGAGSLLAHAQRSSLALLGIAIGIAAIIALLSVGDMSAREAARIFTSLGTDRLVIQIHNAQSGMTAADVTERLTMVSGVAASAPLAIGAAAVGYSENRGGAVIGATPALKALIELDLAEGRFLQPGDYGGLVAVVGANLAMAEDMAASGLEGGLRSVRIGDYVYSVIGVLKPRMGSALDPANFNEAVFVPVDQVHRVLSTPVINGAIVKIKPDKDQSGVATEIVQRLSSDAEPQSVEVRSPQELLQALKEQEAVNTRMLTAIAVIALLVGGIGVMNVMVMSTLERRAEIGLRMAVGARPQDIFIMFLVEAVLLTAVGGLAGVVGGSLMAFLIAHFSGWEYQFAYYLPIIGVFSAAVVGVVSGVAPALRAAQSTPIEALRAT